MAITRLSSAVERKAELPRLLSSEGFNSQIGQVLQLLSKAATNARFTGAGDVQSTCANQRVRDGCWLAATQRDTDSRIEEALVCSKRWGSMQGGDATDIPAVWLTTYSLLRPRLLN